MATPQGFLSSQGAGIKLPEQGNNIVGLKIDMVLILSEKDRHYVGVIMLPSESIRHMNSSKIIYGFEKRAPKARPQCL